jgi:alkylation response protein AidB-like acyl-CoA dehydrogenase
LNRANPSPARQRIIIAQVGSSGTGSALLTLEVEVDAGAVLSESGGGGKSPRSRMASRAVDPGWAMVAAGAAGAAHASAAPSAREKPIVRAMTFVDNNWP